MKLEIMREIYKTHPPSLVKTFEKDGAQMSRGNIDKSRDLRAAVIG